MFQLGTYLIIQELNIAEETKNEKTFCCASHFFLSVADVALPWVKKLVG